MEEGNLNGIEEKGVLNKKSKKLIYRILGIFIAVISLIILIVTKRAYPDFNIWILLVIGIIVLLLSVLLMFGYKLQEWFKKVEEKKGIDYGDGLPPPINKNEARKIAKELLMEAEFADYVNDITDEGTEEHGEKPKSTIYFMICSGVYFRGRYVILINCHYPKINNRVLVEPDNNKIEKAKKMLATYPEEKPDVKTIVSDDPLTGRKITTIEEVQNKKKEKEKKKAKEDLVENE